MPYILFSFQHRWQGSTYCYYFQIEGLTFDFGIAKNWVLEKPYTPQALNTDNLRTFALTTDLDIIDLRKVPTILGAESLTVELIDQTPGYYESLSKDKKLEIDRSRLVVKNRKS